MTEKEFVKELYTTHEMFLPYDLINDALSLYLDALTSLSDLARPAIIKAHLIKHLQNTLSKYIEKDRKFEIKEIEDVINSTTLTMKDYTEYFKKIKILDVLLEKLNENMGE